MVEPPSARKASIAESPHLQPAQSFKKWAVIVGISKYKNANLDLKYADRDADKLYQLLITPQAGAA